MDWRTWAYNRLWNSAPITSIVPQDFIFGSGSMLGVPAIKPFLVIAFGPENPEVRDGDLPAATSRQMTLYAHDEPGDYSRIETILRLCRVALCGPVADGVGGILVEWQGDSIDLADDAFKTIMRSAEFRLLGKAG